MPYSSKAQTTDTVQLEESELTFRYSERYLEVNIQALDKYNARLKRQQSHMLSRLARKERRLMDKLRRKDSATYARLSSEGRSFDSLSMLSRTSINNSSETIQRKVLRASPAIDSLRRVESFLQSRPQGAVSNGGEVQTGYGEKLDKLNNELAYRKQIEKWSAERMTSLKSSLAKKAGDVAGLKGMEKTVFYTGSRIKAYRELAENPTRLEEKALEYLQGTEGFEKAMSQPLNAPIGQSTVLGNSPQNVPNVASAAELEKMGFQTKRSLQTHLQQSFGGQGSSVQQPLAAQLKEHKQKVSEWADAGQKLKTDFHQFNKKPASFKINPMRGLPFLQRLEKGYTLQAMRASAGPASLEVGTFAGFRHTPRLSYGLGASLSCGLGQNWDNIKITLSDFAVRAYARWEWLYGFSAYAECQKSFLAQRQSTKGALGDNSTSGNNVHMLAGMQKSYQITIKRKGAIQLLVDSKWRQQGLLTPFIFRTIIF